ncbi:antibiotic biosynthesis monooxygenase [Neptunomonas phycophila]|uniref:Antibiotic biosynthesis monooxygenase n=1 Tax=Neptunomonas phycophila TaxID=1572645 RepID=A0AAW7XFA4_9GAMM|nr:antibiotic biosynthesis monooxygenase [Neptunomonas phycophila]MDO6452852.1 antibiotic biosynthesis monooxygenase [Neptunomonas phycophila]
MSKKVYCTAQFQPKTGLEDEVFAKLQALEPNAHREDACILYTVTRHISSPFADGDSFPIVFHEIWADMESFEAHCQREEIKAFFAENCDAEHGPIIKWNVTIYSDEPNNFDAPIIQKS